MFTLLKYVISLLIWIAVAALLVIFGKIVYLVFWFLFGAFLLLIWFGKLLYKIIFMFNPSFKPIKIVIAFILIIIGGLLIYKVYILPSWNKWGSTDEEYQAKYEADEYCMQSDIRIVRTVEVNVPSEEIFKWVRQMPETGSYSWDLFDFHGGKSVEHLIDNLPDLKKGDRFLFGEIINVHKNEDITFDIGSDPSFPKLGVKCMYGGYYFRQINENKTRVSMVMKVDYDGIGGWFYSQAVIQLGDFIMATRQLSKLKELAERNHNA